MFLQVLIELLLNPHTAFTEKQQVAKCFCLLARHIKKSVLADFIFKVMFNPIRQAILQENIHIQLSRATDSLVSDSVAATPRPDSSLLLSPSLRPERGSFIMAGPQTKIVIDFGADINIERSHIILEYPTSEQVYECMLGTLLAVWAVCRSPFLLRELVWLRVAPSIINLCFESLGRARTAMRKTAEEILTTIDACPEAAEARPQILASLGVKQTKQATELRQTRKRVIELEGNLEAVQIEVEELRALLQKTIAAVGRGKNSPELKSLARVIKGMATRRTFLILSGLASSGPSLTRPLLSACSLVRPVAKKERTGGVSFEGWIQGANHATRS